MVATATKDTPARCSASDTHYRENLNGLLYGMTNRVCVGMVSCGFMVSTLPGIWEEMEGPVLIDSCQSLKIERIKEETSS